jgi:hypothetical protein
VEPGQTLAVTAEVLKFDDGDVKLKAYGTVGGRIIVSARLTLACYNLADSDPEHLSADEATRDDLRLQLALLHQPRIDISATSAS